MRVGVKGLISACGPMLAWFSSVYVEIMLYFMFISLCRWLWRIWRTTLSQKAMQTATSCVTSGVATSAVFMLECVQSCGKNQRTTSVCSSLPWHLEHFPHSQRVNVWGLKKTDDNREEGRQMVTQQVQNILYHLKEVHKLWAHVVGWDEGASFETCWRPGQSLVPP